MTGKELPRRINQAGRGLRAGTGFILLIAVALSAACLTFGCSKKQEKAKAEKINNVKIWVVEKRSVRPYLETIGTLSPNEEVIVSSEVDGILKDITIDEGSQVAKGTVLARVSDTDYRLNVANAKAACRQAEANLANLKLELGRKEALYKEELVTQQQLDDVSTRMTVASQDLDRAKVALSLAEEKLSKATISSPIKGIVSERKVTSGDFIRASMPVLSIVQIDPLKLSFTVTEKDVGVIQIGQEVIFTVDAFPGQEFTGKLSVIYPGLEERTRTLKAEALVKNPGFKLKPGLFAKVMVYTGEAKEAVVVPATSILYEGTRVRVFLQEGNKAKEEFLTAGDKYGDMIEVLEGLKGGESLIVVGQNNLTDGVKINVVK